MKGAEAILKNAKMLGREIIIKERIPKTYRIPELDKKLRKERTKREAKLLHCAKSTNLNCPTVLFVDMFAIGMTKIKGKRPKMNKKDCETAGEILANLHKLNIIHGDFTPANLLKNKEGIFIIDFGLGFFSSDIEDKAIDVLTMQKCISKQNEFLKGYEKISGEYEKIIRQIQEIKKRARYAQK